MNTTSLKLILVSLLLATSTAHGGQFVDRQRRAPRFRAAEAQHMASVEQRFRDAGAAWPPKVMFRGFKLEGRFEVWAAPAAGDRWVPVESLAVCAASGVLGPKRRQGDLQVPEGYYHIERFNPRSQFHLSLGINYPNAVDRAHRIRGRALGGDIFIHGSCVTIGCLPLQDEPMEAVYLAAVAARDAGQRRIPVHLFPCAFGTETCEAALTAVGEGELAQAARWAELRAGFGAFEATRQPPRVRPLASGHYRIRVVGAP
jgi:murein L,D-transpeptidase YafK